MCSRCRIATSVASYLIGHRQCPWLQQRITLGGDVDVTPVRKRIFVADRFNNQTPYSPCPADIGRYGVGVNWNSQMVEPNENQLGT